jgi:osmotically-inducible protein OsmY
VIPDAIARRLPGNRRSGGSGRKVVLLSAAAAVAAYFFDPRMGRTRRAQVSSRLGGLFRTAARRTGDRAEYAAGRLEGLKHAGSKGDAPPSDVALKDKIESEVLSRGEYPKGRINVTVVDGVAELHGTCDTPDQMQELESEVRKVTGVLDVRSHLHLPKTPAPNKEDSLRAGS